MVEFDHFFSRVNSNITEPTGEKFALINDIRFKGKTKEEWKEIEVYLKEYIVKAKANAAQAVGELIQIAANKSASEDYKGKHGAQAKYG